MREQVSLTIQGKNEKNFQHSEIYIYDWVSLNVANEGAFLGEENKLLYVTMCHWNRRPSRECEYHMYSQIPLFSGISLRKQNNCLFSSKEKSSS